MRLPFVHRAAGAALKQMKKTLILLSAALLTFVAVNAQATITVAQPTVTVPSTWVISDVRAVRTESHQAAGYTSAQITTYDASGAIVDARLFTPADSSFGNTVFVNLLAPGQWLYEKSTDGVTYYNVGGSQEDANGNQIMLTGGTGMFIQVGIAARPGSPEVWGRATLKSVPAPTPAPVPAITPAAVKQITNNVAVLQSNVASLQKDVAALKKKNGLK
jgi:hypothetical protein